ncbi:hypothetical protein BHM03_00008095 [Ensete ventricosum]|nr:hypothetical protein BHM03_00008095 [Ensete ventricosum]
MNICHVGATFLFAFFPLEVSETTIPFGLLCLAEQLVPCSAPANGDIAFRNSSSIRAFRRSPSPLDYSVLLNNLCLVLPPQMHLLDCDSSPIQSPLHPSRQDGDGEGAAREQGVVRRAPPQVRRARRRNPSALLRHAPPIVTRKESRRTVSAGDEAARARRRRKSKGGLPERKSLLPISNRRPASLLRKMRIRRPEDGAPGIGIVLAMALEKVR